MYKTKIIHFTFMQALLTKSEQIITKCSKKQELYLQYYIINYSKFKF